MDEGGGAPLAAAVVTIEELDRSATTGSDGAFSFSDVPAGDYSVSVRRQGFAPLTSRVTVAAGAPVVLDLRLPVAEFEERVTVTGIRGELGLADATEAGSRLGLRAMDIPASIDVIDSTVMQTRGFQRISDALETVARRAGGPRSGRAVQLLGARPSPARRSPSCATGSGSARPTWSMRPQNTFNLDRVELLRGPSSVLNGQGAVAGTVNAVTRQAMPTAEPEWNALFSYGRFNTYQTAIGVNGRSATRSGTASTSAATVPTASSIG